MGKELPMARQEEEGQSVLLAITGNGEIIDSSCDRNQRTKKSAPTKRRKRRKTEDTETESKGSSETERADTSPFESEGRGRDNQDREQGGGDEGEDKQPRRSAQELGIVFPGSFCDKEETSPHYWIESERVYGGVLFRCRKCLDYLWLPLIWNDAERLCKIMKIFGVQEGYRRYLNRHRSAKLLMAKMQDLRRLAEGIAKGRTGKKEFAKLADKILSDMEYDRKEEN